MNDLISRQAALTALTSTAGVGNRALDKIRSLPSAQPEPCEDVVSRHRLLSDLKELIVAWEKYPVMAEQIKGVEAAIGYVELIPSAQPEPHWIPCSERLPETEEQVLIYAWNVHYVLAKYKEIRTCDGVYKMAWVTEDAYNIPQEIKHEVICWMPLPEPYAGRRTDDR